MRSVIMKRVKYGKPETPIEEREYQYQAHGPVGTIKEISQFFLQRYGYDRAYLFDNDGVYVVDKAGKVKAILRGKKLIESVEAGLKAHGDFFAEYATDSLSRDEMKSFSFATIYGHQPGFKVHGTETGRFHCDKPNVSDKPKHK